MRCNLSVLGGTALAGALIFGAASAQTYSSPSSSNSSMMQQQNTQSMSGPAEKAVTKPLSRVTDPSTTLASATVNDSNGQSVGQVKSVNTSSSGKATSVDVSLTSSSGAAKVVSIKADKLTYDPSTNSLKSSLSMSEINQLPTIQSP